MAVEFYTGLYMRDSATARTLSNITWGRLCLQYTDTCCS